MWSRYMAPPPPPPAYDPYAGYPVAPVPMPAQVSIAAPSSYVPVQVRGAYKLLVLLWFHLSLYQFFISLPFGWSVELLFYKWEGGVFEYYVSYISSAMFAYLISPFV